MKISMGVVKEMQKDVARVLEKHQEEMHTAFLRVGDKTFPVDLRVNIKSEKGKLRVITSISFVKDRCQDSVTNWIDEEQLNIFEVEMEGGADEI